MKTILIPTLLASVFTISSACTTHRVSRITPHQDHLDLTTLTKTEYLFFIKNTKQNIMRCKESDSQKSGKPILKCYNNEVIIDGQHWKHAEEWSFDLFNTVEKS